MTVGSLRDTPLFIRFTGRSRARVYLATYSRRGRKRKTFSFIPIRSLFHQAGKMSGLYVVVGYVNRGRSAYAFYSIQKNGLQSQNIIFFFLFKLEIVRALIVGLRVVYYAVTFHYVMHTFSSDYIIVVTDITPGLTVAIT